MKRRRAKRKMARRKKVGAVHPNRSEPDRRSRAIEVNRPYLVPTRDGPVDRRVATPPGERRLSFGERWSYAPAPEASDYIKLRPRYELFIGGKFVAPRSRKYFDSINPATEEKLAEIAEADAHDVDLAVRSARRAYNNIWSKMSGRERRT